MPVSDNTQLVLSAAACLAVVGVIVRAYFSGSRNALPLPPSPPTWGSPGASKIDECGPVITLRSVTEKCVIIGHYKAAVDIMEKQGAALADHPRLIAAGELLTGGQSVAFAVGDRFRRMPLHTHLRPKATEEYQPLQMLHAKNTVLGILELDDPSDFQKHATKYAATMITKVAFGRNAADDEVKRGRQFVETLFSAVRPGTYLVDSIQWLKYLLWYGQDLRQQFESYQKIFIAQLNRVKPQIVCVSDLPISACNAMDAGPSFRRHLLESEQQHGTFFAAGSNSTATAICSVLMTAACFPEEQAKVQAEIDAVVGKLRAPTFADEQSLPRMCAFISECFRWRLLGPMGFPHLTTKDVIWENYCIPAGTTVFGNNWATSRDPEVYPGPVAFKPQCWIDDEGHMIGEDIVFFAFGFGRHYALLRPGQHVASRLVFINAVLVFWAFQVALDAMQSLNDLGYLDPVVMPLVQPCTLEFEKKIPESEIRRMLQNYPEDA
ncbi:cytochrome P450 [Suillus ampliporus]|nr:cytochrome P450 [Suillus ampliporus]